MSDAKTLNEIKETVEKWWCSLQFERKCSSTNTVQKIVNSSSPEIQEEIRHVIAGEIKKLIAKCFSSTSDLNDFQRTCNAINGCFDNFTHATDAVRLLFSDIISFINFGLDKCQVKVNLGASQKNAVLELLHSLSRILILVLKLKRTQNMYKAKNNLNNKYSGVEFCSIQDCKYILCDLTYKIGQFLMMDDILIDTKNNLSMSVILIREILIPDENELIKFHESFIKSIPSSLSDDCYKLNVLKFLISSAIINTWSTNIVDNDSTHIYLKFLISLCEKYSSETPIAVNTSRTLLLLIRHEAFKKFVEDAGEERVGQIIPALLSCVFMLLEHPVACVRHSARDFFQVLATHPSLHSIMIESVFKAPTEKRSYFISIGALANAIGSEILIKTNPELPAQLISALCDPTIVSHVSLALEFVILNDPIAEKDFPKWCETYIVPLLISLMTVLPIVAADIEKLLEKAFKKYPNSVVYVIDKWSNPTSCEELRYVVTALKISQKQGLKLKNCTFSAGKFDKNREKDLTNEKLLQHCLHQRDDDIRISAFSLIIEAHKSTKPYSESDFNLIQYFLRYNLNNQQPATRQKILGLIRKMLVRFSESRATFLKPSKNKEEQEEKEKNRLMYDRFLDSLVEFCFSNVFVGCNFNRLNTVLNILLLCFENVKDKTFNSDKTNFYWSKFLIALDSSYEENKELAVILTKKLDLSLLDANDIKSAKLLYEKAFNLCTHMEPPDVLTGSYLLQALIALPSSGKTLSSYFVDDYVFDDVCYYCIKVLTQKLREQIQLAKLDLMTAATCGPMYGALFAIRLIFKNVDFSSDGRVQDESLLKAWGKILNELVELSFDMTRIVGCVVNSSSPEGHLPMDFQTDFENLLSLRDKNEMTECDETTPSLTKAKTLQLIHTVCNNFIKKFRRLESDVENPNCDTYESLRSLNVLLKENKLLLCKVKALNGGGQCEEERLLDILTEVEEKLLDHLERLQKMSSVVEWPATAQVLLLCAWRSIKEASLYLGDLFTKLPVETEIKLGLLTESTIISVGEELKTLLCEIKHRGAFEHAYIGFMQLVNCLWKCSDKNLSRLPRQWLEDITNQLESPLSDQKVKLCSTRRSAGLPFLVQAIICSEMVSTKSTTPASLHTTIKSLLRITENGVLQNPESKIHALNVLRALFKHAHLGQHVASYVSKALMVAIRGSRAATWSERNSSSLLFSSLMIRIFGVSRSRDEISKKNRMTSRTFFQRYSELYDFLLSEMELVYSDENHADGHYPKPSLYLVLLILGRLYPPPTEDPENIDLSEFLPYINMSRRNPTMKIRELGARALVPLISLDRLSDELDGRFSVLHSTDGTSENEKHGILLQIKELLSQPQETVENLSKECPEKQETWIENTKWMLNRPQQTSLVTISAYVKVLHILFRNFSSSRQKVADLIKNSPVPDYLLRLDPAEQSKLPGIYLFLERFYFLKTDVLAWEWGHYDGTGEKFFELFTSMLNCEIGEVQSVPFRILCYVLREGCGYSLDDDDFSGIGAPVTDLLLFQSKTKMDSLQAKLLSNSDVLRLLTEDVSGRFFKSKPIHRMWLSVVSTLVMNGVISVPRRSQPSGPSLKIDFAKSLIKSGDKELSTGALICYSVFLLEEISSMSRDERCELADVLDEFSSPEADVKERLAVAKILNRCCANFGEKSWISDPVTLNIWMIPLKLLADEDPGVRVESAELVRKMQEHIIKNIPTGELLIKMKTLDWPHLPLVSLKAQECLLDCYINILGFENLQNLIGQMLILAVSSLCDLDDSDGYPKDEFGVFEKGNPNPFCEDLALSDLTCSKLTELNSVMDLDSVMWRPLDGSLGRFVAESLRILDFVPLCLMQVVEMVTTLVEESEKLRGEFSLPRAQVRNLRAALGLEDVF